MKQNLPDLAGLEKLNGLKKIGIYGYRSSEPLHIVVAVAEKLGFEHHKAEYASGHHVGPGPEETKNYWVSNDGVYLFDLGNGNYAIRT